MPTFTMRRHAAALLAVSTICAAGQAGAAGFSAVYAFGDSLSDWGNLYGATLQAYGASGALPQADAYWQGHFSNGPVAVEVLAQALGRPLVDFAFGGARTDFGPSYPTALGTFYTGVQAQLTLHDNRPGGGGVADPNGLYFVWAGSNDLRGALGGLLDPNLTPDEKNAALLAASQSTTDNLKSTVQHLYNEGARHFLLPLLPDFGLTPEGAFAQAQIAGAGSLFSLSAFSESFDAGLRAAYLGLSLSGATVTVFDTLSAQRDVYAHPGTYGIGNVTTPCFTGYVGEAGTLCTTDFTTTNMFWDKVHPSAATHAVLGGLMAAAVPEPATMLTMALGLVALLGWSRRARG
jgi:phospholipase/lecithinase/hemolysin